MKPTNFSLKSTSLINANNIPTFCQFILFITVICSCELGMGICSFRIFGNSGIIIIGSSGITDGGEDGCAGGWGAGCTAG